MDGWGVGGGSVDRIEDIFCDKVNFTILLLIYFILIVDAIIKDNMNLVLRIWPINKAN